MSDHAALMDQVYRHQRHIYDLTRKPYLLGRDRLIEALAPPRGGTVLEVGCGTGRNLLAAAARYPYAALCGFDISDAMLKQARAAVGRPGFSGRIVLARADATSFEPRLLFGRGSFDRIFFSYTLSMIPDWQGALHHAAGKLAPGGVLHIVDFGDQAGLPAWFRAGLRRWLAAFHVQPRDRLVEVCRAIAAEHGAALRHDSLYRGYASAMSITLPG